MKTKLSWGIKIAALFFLIFSNAYSQFTTNPPGGNSALYSRGNVNIGTTLNTVNKLNVTGNSLFSGNTTVTGNGQIRNLGLGIAPNILYRLILSGNSYFNGNIGIGAVPSSSLSTKLLLSSGTNGISGLNFTNLNNTFIPTILNNNKTLNVDSAGNVVLTKTIDNITHNLAGNVLTTTINGVNSNAITLPLAAASSNIYNSSGALTSERGVNLNNNNLYFEQSLVLAFALRPSGNVIGQGTLFGFYDHAMDRSLDPNLNSDGIFEIGGSKNRNQYSLTTGTNDIGNWTQSSIRFNNQAFNYHINPLGGNVGIGVSNATAQLHTKNSVRFENLPTSTNPTSILGTDSNGNVFNFNPNLIGSSSVGDFWSLNGNLNATASSFLGTTNSEALRFRVQNVERLQITNTGRFQVSNSSGSNTNLYFGQDAGNDTAGTFWNVGIGPKTLFNNTGSANTAIGDQALSVNTSGNGNQGIGYRTLLSNTTGNNNSALGHSAGSANLNGNDNVFFGSASGTNSKGDKNIFLGSWAGYTLTSGNNNVFIGSWVTPNISNTGSDQLNIADKIYGSGTPGNTAIGIGVPNPQARLHTNGTLRFENLANSATLPLNILGTDTNGNVFEFNPSLIGSSSSSAGDFWSLNGNSNATVSSFLGTTNSESLKFRVGNLERLQITTSGRFHVSNTSGGNSNLYFGQNAGNDITTSITTNTAFGNSALSSVTTGFRNSAIGYSALNSNTTGAYNTASGNSALNLNTSGGFNTASGAGALEGNTTGGYNTANGVGALAGNTSGNNNTATGAQALNSNGVGDNNTGYGWRAGMGLTGSSNVLVGYSSGLGYTSGNNNVFLGPNTQTSYTTASGDNNVFIGSNILPNISNTSSNQLNIANKIYGSGTGAGAKIGVNVPNPNNALEIKSEFSDASGLRFTNLNLSSPFVANTTNKSLSLNSTGDVVLSNTINTINNNVVGNQFTTTINGVSSAPITLPEQHLEPVLIDSYIGTRLRPVSPTMNGFNIKKNTNTAIGYRAINPNTGIAAVSAIGVGINDTNEYADLTYIAHFSPNYYVPKFAGNGGLLSDKELFIGTYGANRNIDFVTGNTFTTTQSRFKIESDNISSLSYPNTRNDLAVNTPVNFLYTDANGKFLSAPMSAITNSIPNVNIYNASGSLTGFRVVNLNSNRLDFEQNSSMRVRLSPSGYKVDQGSLFEVGSYNITGGLDPNLRNDGIFSINTILENKALTTGANKFGNWTQSANYKERKVLNYQINPLGGNVGIGVLEATAQLHTINSVRFQDLPFSENPKALLGTDENGNVFNIDPSLFGSGASADAWLLNGNSGTNPGTGLGQNFIGTIDDNDLVFGVNSGEKLRIKPSGRIQFFGWAPSNGANSAWNMYIGGGNDNPVSATSNIANLAIGVGSMIQNTTGKFNSSLGFSALENNTTGEANTSFGYQSLRMNTTGHNNLSMGVNAMFNNTIGEYNISIGNVSLLKNVNGSGNVAVGAGTLKENVSGLSNTAVGVDALRETNSNYNTAFGVGALANLGFTTSGDGGGNVALGSFAGQNLINGDRNIFIGYDVQGPVSNNDGNQLNIGNWIFGKNGQIAIGSFNNLPQAFITNNDYQLIVKKGIRTEKVRVDIASVKNWADYVFEDDYKLMSLKELDQYIKANGHLPNIPTSEEVVKQGVDLGEMNSKLLEKVEELTLHTIDLNKKNESQQKVIDDLILRLEKLERNKKQ